MREVKLYGHLGKTFGRSFMLDVSSPAEAIAALSANFSKFKAYLCKHSAPGYKVIVGGRPVSKDDLTHCSGDSVIKFVPVVVGAGGRGVFQSILGAVLVIAGTFIPGAQFLTPVGWGMVVGGVAQMLMPMPSATTQESPDNQPSYTFSGAVNTITQGNPVQLCYGEMIVGSQVISAGISTEQIYVTPPNYDDGAGGGGGSWGDHPQIQEP